MMKVDGGSATSGLTMPLQSGLQRIGLQDIYPKTNLCICGYCYYTMYGSISHSMVF